MRFDTEGIVLKETKISDGRRMIHLFTKKQGKISAGTSINERGKSKSALALKPFTAANYGIYHNRDTYTIASAEVKKAYFELGTDFDKFASGSFILELTERVLAEGEPAPAVYTLLIDFLDELELRPRSYMTLIIAYEIRLLRILGIMPDLSSCAECGEKENRFFLNMREGNILCRSCRDKLQNEESVRLIYSLDSDILEVIRFFSSKPLLEFRKLSLNEKTSHEIQNLIRKYMLYHLDAGPLKSESLLDSIY